jgi:hypothetical protein
VAQRVNTANGVRYADDPTIAMVEIDAPNYTEPLRATTAELTALIHTVLSTYHSLDVNHIAHSGGFSYLNDANSGIDWRTIMADPADDLCAIEIYSFDDENLTVPAVTAYCQGPGKPWFLAACSSCLAPSGGTWDDSHLAGDAEMAAHAQRMYDVQHGVTLSTYPAVGSDFWNLGPDTESPTCEISPGFPETFAVAVANAP